MVSPLCVERIEPRLLRERLRDDLEHALPVFHSLVLLIYAAVYGRAVQDIVLQVDGRQAATLYCFYLDFLLDEFYVHEVFWIFEAFIESCARAGDFQAFAAGEEKPAFACRHVSFEGVLSDQFFAAKIRWYGESFVKDVVINIVFFELIEESSVRFEVGCVLSGELAVEVKF